MVPSPAHQDVLICNFCIDDAQTAIVQKEREIASKGGDKPLPTPREIMAMLDDYVIGQGIAKKTVAAAVYRHYRRRQVWEETKGKLPNGLELEKSNILMTGPSGCGKTQIARTIAKILDVPFYVGDATKLTQAGYVGDDVDTLLQGLLEKCSWNVDRAQWGIIVIDEIDKIARKSGGTGSAYRDVTGEGVQQALLKLVEGGEVTIAKGQGARLMDPTQQQTVTIDTTNILFICMGSFDGIQRVVSQRVNKNHSVGFGGRQKRKEISDKEVYENLSEEDILEFGIIPELAGRLPVLTGVLRLTKEEMVQIMTEPKDAIVKQEKFLYGLGDVTLDFEDEALEAIAEAAQERKTGARAIRGILTNLMLPYDMDVPGSDITYLKVTGAYARGEGDPVIHRAGEEYDDSEVVKALEPQKTALQVQEG